MEIPLKFRNLTRYVNDVEANIPLYEALGFKVIRSMKGMTIMQNEEGVKLNLHVWENAKGKITDTAIGFTVTGTVQEARHYLEKAGFRCLREPEEGDEGFFYIYGDLDSNPINLVGRGHSKSTPSK